MLEQVAAGLIVAAVAAVAAALGSFFRTGHPARLRELVYRWRGARQTASPTVGLPERANKLLRGILEDQSADPPHEGQFGRFASFAEEKAFNPTRERISVKPRMYMTRWPCLILRRNNLAPDAVARALRGVEQLFDGEVIKGQEEWSRIPGRMIELENYRHTMCGALLLLEHRGWNDISSGVLGAMLDAGSSRQNSDGGWAHTSPLPSESDLYSSLYAAQLFCQALESPELPTSMKRLVGPALSRTLEYLAITWSQTQWKFEEMPSEEIAPQAFIEVAPILKVKMPNVHAHIVATLRQYVNPGGGLSRRYRTQ